MASHLTELNGVQHMGQKPFQRSVFCATPNPLASRHLTLHATSETAAPAGGLTPDSVTCAERYGHVPAQPLDVLSSEQWHAERLSARRIRSRLRSTDWCCCFNCIC